MRIVIFCLFIIISTAGLSQLEVRGTVVDSATQQPVSYVNVWLKGTSKGTLTNDLGNFKLDVDSTLGDSIEFSLIGYKPQRFSIHHVPKLRPFYIELVAKSFDLKTAIVTPLSAQEYVRRAIIYMEDNYDTKGNFGRYYYREVIKENNSFNRFSEAVLDLYQPPLNSKPNDTAIIRLKGGHVLDNREYIQFMRDYVKKKVDKKNKKRERKGEETKEFTDATQYISFSNPYIFVDSNFTSKTPSFLDSTHFDKYTYQFEYGYESNGRQMLCISFNQEKKIHETYYSGLIYMVDSSYAIEGIDYGWNEKGKKKLIPAYAKAALWAYRLQVDEPDFQAKMRFREDNGKWNMDHFFIYLQGRLTKKFFFDDNETSLFNINQSFVFIEPIDKIDEDLPLLNRKKTVHGQIKDSNPNINWKKYRKLEPENLKQE